MNFTIYSKDGCPYCSKVQRVLELANLQYEVKKLDVDFNREDFYFQFGNGSTSHKFFWEKNNLVDALKLSNTSQKTNLFNGY